MRFISLAFTFFTLLLIHPVYAQLRCNVQIDGSQMQIQDPGLVKKLQADISQFMNNTQWSEDEYEEHEKIDCDIAITLSRNSDPTTGAFTATLVQVQARRPTFGTDYETTTCVFYDKGWSFKYSNSDPLTLTENSYSTELVALLSFYAYTILSIDYDTFSLEGGLTYREKALQVVNLASSNSGPSVGWSSVSKDKRHRYWIAEHLNNPQFTKYSEALYKYHRLGMDQFHDIKRQAEAREHMLEALKLLKEIFDLQPSSAVIKSFFDAKIQELLKVFSVGDAKVKEEAKNLLLKMDPTNAAQYRKL